MGSNRLILLVLCGLCMLAGSAFAFLGITGQQGVGLMAIGAVLCLAIAGPGLACALLSKPQWWSRTIVYFAGTLLVLASLAMITLRLTGKDFSHNSELWHLSASKGALIAVSTGLLALAASIAAVVHSIRVVNTSNPLGPLDWNTQSTRYSDQLVSGRAQPTPVQPRGDSTPDQSATGVQPPKRFVPGFSNVAPQSLTPAGASGSSIHSVPDGVLPKGTQSALPVRPVTSSSRLPYALLALIAIFAVGGGAGVWYLSRGPRTANASAAIATTVATQTYPQWGFGFDVPGAPFEQIDAAQFSTRAVLAVTRKEPAMRFYVIAERRDDGRSLEESARVLREAMTDIAPGATTLLDNAAQLEGIDGWRLLTRVRVGATDTFYCHWLGEVKGVSLQLWVVGTGKDAQSFAREADTLFDRFFLLKDDASTAKHAGSAARPEAQAAPSPAVKDGGNASPAPSSSKTTSKPPSNQRNNQPGKPATKGTSKPAANPSTPPR